jgi:NhaP-type Na+/H+ or K+/H+ antiporter
VETSILVVALAVLVFGLFAGRLRGTSLTAPMVFTAAGLLLGQAALGVLDVNVDSGFVSALAEATLVVVLFTDASRMDLRTVARQHSLALRLLLVGLPLAIAVGARERSPRTSTTRRSNRMSQHTLPARSSARDAAAPTWSAPTTPWS